MKLRELLAIHTDDKLRLIIRKRQAPQACGMKNGNYSIRHVY